MLIGDVILARGWLASASAEAKRGGARATAWLVNSM